MFGIAAASGLQPGKGMTIELNTLSRINTQCQSSSAIRRKSAGDLSNKRISVPEACSKSI
jgi:hypothetical protein